MSAPDGAWSQIPLDLWPEAEERLIAERDADPADDPEE